MNRKKEAVCFLTAPCAQSQNCFFYTTIGYTMKDTSAHAATIMITFHFQEFFTVI